LDFGIKTKSNNFSVLPPDIENIKNQGSLPLKELTLETKLGFFDFDFDLNIIFILSYYRILRMAKNNLFLSRKKILINKKQIFHDQI
jgi:hypothetical protein